MLPLAVNYDPPAAIKLSFPATTRARSAVGPSLSLAQRFGTHYQTSSATHRYRLTVSVASLKHSCLQTRSSVHSALEIFLLMRHINLRLLTLLTYLLTRAVIINEGLHLLQYLGYCSLLGDDNKNDTD